MDYSIDKFRNKILLLKQEIYDIASQREDEASIYTTLMYENNGFHNFMLIKSMKQPLTDINMMFKYLFEEMSESNNNFYFYIISEMCNILAKESDSIFKDAFFENLINTEINARSRAESLISPLCFKLNDEAMEKIISVLLKKNDNKEISPYQFLERQLCYREIAYKYHKYSMNYSLLKNSTFLYLDNTDCFEDQVLYFYDKYLTSERNTYKTKEQFVVFENNIKKFIGMYLYELNRKSFYKDLKDEPENNHAPEWNTLDSFNDFLDKLIEVTNKHMSVLSKISIKNGQKCFINNINTNNVETLIDYPNLMIYLNNLGINFDQILWNLLKKYDFANLKQINSVVVFSVDKKFTKKEKLIFTFTKDLNEKVINEFIENTNRAFLDLIINDSKWKMGVSRFAIFEDELIKNARLLTLSNKINERNVDVKDKITRKKI